MSSWYYSKNGEQRGPVSGEGLSALKSNGEVIAADLVWKEGMPDWVPFGQVDEFSAGTPPSAPGENIPLAQPRAYSSQQAHQTHSMRNIPNYLWQAILVTVLCCMPFGVVSIVYAAKVDGLVARGDIGRAYAASKSAKNWALAGVGLWFAIIIIYILIALLAAEGSNF